jgi:Mg-chelatase subunit ChlD
MSLTEAERLRRWRLFLGKDSCISNEETDGLTAPYQAMDEALAALYEGERSADLRASSPYIARWLGDIRTYFPVSAVQILQQDALEMLHLHQILMEPELLSQLEPDVNLVATILSFKQLLSAQTRETARHVVRKIVEELERRLGTLLVQAVRGSLNKVHYSYRPKPADIDWDRTIRANLKHYRPEQAGLLLERLVGHPRKQKHSSLRDIILCIDQSGSMATSVVYSSIFGAVLASLRAVSTRMVVFDTAVVDLTEELHDPVELLFAAQLGGGTNINRALAYCERVITRPSQTILVLISDLYEGGNEASMIERAARLVESGVQLICLLALSDRGTPVFSTRTASRMAALGVPTFACTPDLFPDLMAAAIQRRDLNLWAAQQEIVTVRAVTGESQH